MRGVPGSGKSTLAKKIGEGGIIISSDDFFIKDGVYKFDGELLFYAHIKCVKKAEHSMMEGISPVVIDNVNLRRKEAKPYVELSKQYGYEVEIVEPDTPWKLDAEELFRRNTHNVKMETIERFIRRYHGNNPFNLDTIMESNSKLLEKAKTRD